MTEVRMVREQSNIHSCDWTGPEPAVISDAAPPVLSRAEDFSGEIRK